MTDKILDWCRREDLFCPGAHVVCALSGGADSVALLHCLLTLREDLQITVSAAHYNHCLRGEASDGDEAFVRRLCASWGVSLAVGRGDVAAHAAETGKSMEEAARDLRYEFLLRQPGLIAVAHHSDDQVETVLLNLLRGTGLRGLCAMAPRQDRLVRPLLAVDRQQIEDYLREKGLEHREDATNAEDGALRNRLRHHVIPALQAENPALSRTVGRMTGLLREEEDFLTRQAEQLLQQARREGGWDCRVLAQAPRVLRRRAIRQLLENPKPSMAHVEAVEQLLQSCSGSASAELSGGWVALREYDLLRLTCEAQPPIWQPAAVFPDGGMVWLGEQFAVTAEETKFLEKTADSLSTFALRYDMMKGNPSLIVRPRQTGDALQLPGGTKSLKRLMIDRKIPAALRPQVPVVTAGDAVVAVYGLGTDVRWAARPGDRAIIVKIWFRGEKLP